MAPIRRLAGLPTEHSVSSIQQPQATVRPDTVDDDEEVSLLWWANSVFQVVLLLMPVLMGTTMLAALVVLCFTSFGLAAGLALLAILALSLVARVFYFIRSSRVAMTDLEAAVKSGKKNSAPDLSKFSAVSYLYVLGSGGHTTEMIALIKLSFKPNQKAHRRYIIAAGDITSMKQKGALEQLIWDNCLDGTAGTHDTCIVRRARSVHQSWFTSIFTIMRAALEILVALIMVPVKRAGQPNARDFRFPHVIVTNGPGTGFVVALVAFILKVLWLVPRNRLKVVFVESWARTHNLAITGKLFNWLDIADLFVVQNDRLARDLNKPNIGNVNKRLAQTRGSAVASRQ